MANKPVMIRMSDKLIQIAKDKADELGITMAEYIRKLIVNDINK